MSFSPLQREPRKSRPAGGPFRRDPKSLIDQPRQKRSERRPRGLGPGTTAAQKRTPTGRAPPRFQAGGGRADAGLLLFANVRDTSPRGLPRGRRRRRAAPQQLFASVTADKRGRVPPPSPAADDGSPCVSETASGRDHRGRRPRQAHAPAERARRCHRPCPRATGFRPPRGDRLPSGKAGGTANSGKKKPKKKGHEGASTHTRPPCYPRGGRGPGGGARPAPLTPHRPRQGQQRRLNNAFFLPFAFGAARAAFVPRFSVVPRAA